MNEKRAGTRPVIGITVDTDDAMGRYLLHPGYSTSIEKAGGLPLLLPYRTDISLIPQIVDLLDGVLFSGGNDLDLRARGMSAEIIGNGRVSKYAQRYTEKLNLGRRESAILCVLLLRGPQTLGEIKGRTERVYEFADLDEVEMVLQKLAARDDGALTQKLTAAPGMKEPRWAQTLGGPVDFSAQASAHTPGVDRMAALETEVARLREEVAELRRRLEEVL